MSPLFSHTCTSCGASSHHSATPPEAFASIHVRRLDGHLHAWESHPEPIPRPTAIDLAYQALARAHPGSVFVVADPEFVGKLPWAPKRPV